MSHTLRAAAVVFVLASALAVGAAEGPATNAPAPPANTNNAAAIAPADIASQVEVTMTTLQNLNAGLEIDQTSQTVEGELPALISLVDSKLDDTASDLAGHPTLPRLHRLEDEWSKFHDELSKWKRDLTKRAQKLGELTARL